MNIIPNDSTRPYAGDSAQMESPLAIPHNYRLVKSCVSKAIR